MNDHELHVEEERQTEDAIRRYRFTVSYDGTDYVGWQLQPNGPSIQAELEGALTRVTGFPARVIGAGRTDSGVHARGQVAHVDLVTSLHPEVLERAVNACLPQDIAVRDLCEAERGFHARYSASSRAYAYRVTYVRSVLDRRIRWHLTWRPDPRRIQEAVEGLPGPHLFMALSRPGKDVAHQGCHVFTASWEEEPEGAIFQIRANRFLHGMVRYLVGGLIEVGSGKRTREDFLYLLDVPERNRMPKPAPPHGLVLEEVRYDPEEWREVKGGSRIGPA